MSNGNGQSSYPGNHPHEARSPTVSSPAPSTPLKDSGSRATANTTSARKNLPNISTTFAPYQNISSRLRSMTALTRQAPLTLDFIVVGGSIAGLAVAHELSRHGHRVTVLEKSSGLGQLSGGVRVPPNLSKILLDWGCADDLRNLATRVRASTFRAMDTGEIIGYLEWQEDVLREIGADFFLMGYDDLHRILYRLATSSGATILFDSAVTTVSVDDESDSAHVLLANGKVLKADMVIGADGCNSVVREVVTDEDNDGIPSGMSCYTTTIPISSMDTDPELSELMRTPEWPLWMEANCSVLGYPTGKRGFAIHAWRTDPPGSSDDVPEGWTVLGRAEDCQMPVGESRISKMLALIPEPVRVKHVERDLAEEWTDESGRLVLMGDAAHPLPPCTIHGQALAVEDAVVFGTLFSRLRRRDQITALTDAYQELRYMRCKEVRAVELYNKRMVWLPKGGEREKRNAHMKQFMTAGTKQWDEGQLREQWEQTAGPFGYSARDAAEDWWVNWGALRERSQSVINPLDFDLQSMISNVITTPIEAQSEVVSV